MSRRTGFSVMLAVLSTSMLLAAALASAAGSAPRGVSSSQSTKALRGGTLRVNASNNDFEFSDPGIAYDNLSWSMLFTTQMLLVNFPEKNGQAGSVLIRRRQRRFRESRRTARPMSSTSARG